MKKIRLQNLLSLVCNLLIVVFTIHAFWYNFRTDVIRDEFWFGYSGIHSLRFFTVLSNLFVMLAAAIMLVYNFKNVIGDKYVFPRWAVAVKFVATTAVAVTFVTVVVFLAPAYAIIGKGYFKMFVNNNLFMHLLTPLLAIFSFVFFEHVPKLKFSKVWLTLIPTALYSVVYFVMVVLVTEENGGWIDFYNFTFGGHNWAIPLSAIGMLLMTFLLGLALWSSHNARAKHFEKLQTKSS